MRADDLVDELPVRLRPLCGWWLRFVNGARDAQLPFTVALFLGAALFSALGQLDRILSAIHDPGEPAFGMASLSGSPLSLPVDGQAGIVAKTWAEGAVDGFTSPATLGGAYVVLDLAFIVAYGWVLAVVLLRLRGWLTTAAAAKDALSAAVDRRMAKEEVLAKSAADEAERIWDLVDRYARVLTIACAGVLGLAAIDLVEAALQTLALVGCVQDEPARGCAGAPLTVALYLATLVKWLAFAAVALTIAFGFLELASFQRDRVRQLMRVLVRLRAPLVLVAMLAFAYMVRASPFADQIADLLRRWQEQPWHAGSAAVLTVGLGAVIFSCARGLVEATRARTAAGPTSSSGLFLAGGIALVVGAFAALVWPPAPGLLVLAGLLLVLAVLSALAGPIADDPPQPAAGTFGAGALPALLAVAPLVVLGLAVQGAALAEVAWSWKPEFLVWLIVGVLLQIAGWVAYRPLSTPNGGGSGVALSLGAAVVVVVAIWTWKNPWSVAEVLGGTGIVAAFAIALALLGSGLGRVAELTRPPSAIRLLGFRRTPFLLLLVLWGVSAAIVSKGGFHDTRMLGTSGASSEPQPGLTVKALFTSWRKANGLPVPRRASERPKPSSRATPLVLVAASGGGIRAAYWTAQTLDCLFGERGGTSCSIEGPGKMPVIAGSGVSGGSLGLTAWSTHLETPEKMDWTDTLKADNLTPAAAWGLFVDLPNSLLHTDRVPDRAEILERSWEREWLSDGPTSEEVLDDRSPLAKGMFATRGELPLLMLNGTAVESGCRINVSELDANVDQQRPRAHIEDCLSVRALESANNAKAARTAWALGGSVDINRFVCQGQDLRLSTAVLLSARFPYISPSARLTACGHPDFASYLVDGGYFDSSAADTAVQLWTALKPIVERYNKATGSCVVPFAIQIDNGYDEPPGPDPGKRPPESTVPLRTALATRAARESSARQALALAVSKPVGDIRLVKDGKGEEVLRYAHIYPRAHPGTQAPLGWALSDATATDLAKQLVESNQDALKTIWGRWIKPDALRCERHSSRVP